MHMWNALPISPKEAQSLNTLKKLVYEHYLTPYCILVIYLFLIHFLFFLTYVILYFSYFPVHPKIV
jgi:hypothetical protein